MIIKTVAQLKRELTVGRKIEMIAFNGGEPTEKIAGVGTIVKVQTNGVYIDRGNGKSWMDFPKASGFIQSYTNDNTFEINLGWVSLVYKLID